MITNLVGFGSYGYADHIGEFSKNLLMSVEGIHKLNLLAKPFITAGGLGSWLKMTECHHKNVTDWPKYAIDDPPGHYRCEDCGDTFPLIGDTDQWEPKMIERKDG